MTSVTYIHEAGPTRSTTGSDCLVGYARPIAAQKWSFYLLDKRNYLYVLNVQPVNTVSLPSSRLDLASLFLFNRASDRLRSPSGG